jgi:hypothetical protein
MTKIIYFSRLLPQEDKGGGCRRLLQIQEFLKRIHPQVELVHPWRSDLIPPEKEKKLYAQNRGKVFYSLPLPGVFINKWSDEHQGMIYRFHAYSRIWIHAVPDLGKLDLAVMDDPIYFLPLFKKLIRNRVPVIAVCHNIESVVPGQVRKNRAREVLEKELELLSQCRLVITISREEDVILRNFGITSRFMPYYPVESIEKRLLALREKRRYTSKEDILMVGTSKNLPTREGMMRAASYWKEKGLEKLAGKLIVGGFFSEEYLAAMPVGESVDYHGTFSREELDGVMEKVKACLCYQESGAGALTRICEMLIAGVPVLANTHAARSYYNVKGVYEFRQLDELEEALKQIEAFDGDIPLPPAPDLSALETELKKIMK